jgi:hypothetical protein
MGIRITEDIISKMRRPEAGWQKMEVKRVVEKASKDKKSMNYIFSFEVIESATDDKNIGRSIDRYFNTQEGALPFFFEFVAAVWNLKEDEMGAKLAEMVDTEAEIDPNGFVGAQVWGELEDGIYNNKPTINVSDNWCSVDGDPPF